MHTHFINSLEYILYKYNVFIIYINTIKIVKTINNKYNS